MTMRLLLVVLILILSSAFSWAGEQVGLEFNQQRRNLIHQSFQTMDSLSFQQKEAQKKSVFLSAVYSGVLPGTGQWYAGSRWKAAIFFGLEVAGWAAFLVYDNKGNDQDKIMRAYGDDHWIEQRYWSKLYYEAVEKGDIPNLPVYELEEVDNGYMLKDYDAEMVSSLRFLEEALGHTHRLPPTKTQQYYEMIYKYLTQFGNAWEDADFYFTYYGNTDTMTPQMFEYRDIRNEMNNFYDISSAALNVILINHVLSALDAAITTRNYNQSLSVGMRVQNISYYGEKVQLYGLQLRW
jgi:hypothetical protein